MNCYRVYLTGNEEDYSYNGTASCIDIYDSYGDYQGKIHVTMTDSPDPDGHADPDDNSVLNTMWMFMVNYWVWIMFSALWLALSIGMIYNAYSFLLDRFVKRNKMWTPLAHVLTLAICIALAACYAVILLSQLSDIVDNLKTHFGFGRGSGGRFAGVRYYPLHNEDQDGDVETGLLNGCGSGMEMDHEHELSPDEDENDHDDVLLFHSSCPPLRIELLHEFHDEDLD